MKPGNHTKKIIFLAFLLSLLFHFGSIVYVAIQNNNKKTILSPEIPIQKELKQKINKQEQQNEWVETKARAGNFGAPVFFQDYFEEEVTTKEQEQLKETPPQEEPQQEKKEEITKPVMPEEKIEITSTHQPTTTAIEQEIKPAQRTSSKNPILRQVSDFAKASSNTQDERIKNKPLSAPKPPITLSQLTQGFLNHVKDEGTHAIHMLGKKSGTPSDEQMKYERYLQKLSWCLQNSFNIYNDRFPSSANRDDTAQVLLSLNKDGTMRQCHVSKTSGNRNLDHFIVFIFNDASSSFPPVPQYLPHDPFTINYIIMVSASEENRWKLYRQ